MVLSDNVIVYLGLGISIVIIIGLWYTVKYFSSDNIYTWDIPKGLLREMIIDGNTYTLRELYKDIPIYKNYKDFVVLIILDGNTMYLNNNGKYTTRYYGFSYYKYASKAIDLSYKIRIGIKVNPVKNIEYLEYRLVSTYKPLRGTKGWYIYEGPLFKNRMLLSHSQMLLTAAVQRLQYV